MGSVFFCIFWLIFVCIMCMVCWEDNDNCPLRYYIHGPLSLSIKMGYAFRYIRWRFFGIEGVFYVFFRGWVWEGGRGIPWTILLCLVSGFMLINDNYLFTTYHIIHTLHISDIFFFYCLVPSFIDCRVILDSINLRFHNCGAQLSNR